MNPIRWIFGDPRGVTIEPEPRGIVECLRQSARKAMERGDLVTRGDCLMAASDIERLTKLYNELLYAVACKHPGETRHQTALRYIQQAEHQSGGPSEAAKQS